MGCGWLTPTNNSKDALQRHLPTGYAWDAFRIVGKNLYSLFAGIAGAFDDAWNALCNMTAELDPRTTVHCITDWETAVGLPSACIPIAPTLAQRQAWVMFRLNKQRYTTLQAWYNIAALFGFQICITPGEYVQRLCAYPLKYPYH
jgi:uncharacterized protein YmfQ (DUF2313 family)